MTTGFVERVKFLEAAEKAADEELRAALSPAPASPPEGGTAPSADAQGKEIPLPDEETAPEGAAPDPEAETPAAPQEAAPAPPSYEELLSRVERAEHLSKSDRGRLAAEQRRNHEMAERLARLEAQTATFSRPEDQGSRSAPSRPAAPATVDPNTLDDAALATAAGMTEQEFGEWGRDFALIQVRKQREMEARLEPLARLAKSTFETALAAQVSPELRGHAQLRDFLAFREPFSGRPYADLLRDAEQSGDVDRAYQVYAAFDAALEPAEGATSAPSPAASSATPASPPAKRGGVRAKPGEMSPTPDAGGVRAPETAGKAPTQAQLDTMRDDLTRTRGRMSYAQYNEKMEQIDQLAAKHKLL